MTPNPRHIITGQAGQKTVMYRDGDTTAIIRVIMHADRDSARFVRPEGLPWLQGANEEEALRNIYALLQGRIDYRADRPGHEIVRSPAYLFESGMGDCKSYSVAIGALCRAFGIPYRYRFTSQGRKDFHHVYVVATLPDGRDVVLDAVPDSGGKYLPFGGERPYARHADLKPGQRVPAGLRGAEGSSFWQDSGTLVLVFLLIIFIFSRKGK